MRQKLVQYMITPVFNRAALDARSQGMTADQYRAEITAGTDQLLKDIRQPVSDIVAKHAGVMVQDGSNYGVPGKPGEFSRYMIVQTPEKALVELRAIPDVRVERFERSTFTLPKSL